MDIAVIGAFWLVSALFVITPGADWAFAITAGLRDRIAPAVAGLLLGHLAATAVVAAGVGGLVSRFPVVLASLTIAGATYLVWLGVNTLVRPPKVGTVRKKWEHESRDAPSGGNVSSESSARWLMKGLGVSGLNPKVFLLFLALLPQFTTEDSRWPVALQICALGLIHVLSCAVVYTAVALGSRAVLGTRPAAARIVTRVSGAAMMGIGIFLLLERLFL